MIKRPPTVVVLASRDNQAQIPFQYTSTIAVFLVPFINC